MSELDEDLLLELDQVVKDNQLAFLPFARSGRADALLFDKYPELAEKIEQGRRAKIDSITMSNKFREGDGGSSTAFRAHSFDDHSPSPFRQKSGRRASREAKMDAESPLQTPVLKGRASVSDLIFDMSDGDEDEDKVEEQIKPPLFNEKPSQGHPRETPPVGSPEEAWSASSIKGRSTAPGLAITDLSPADALIPNSPAAKEGRPSGQPWGSTSLGQAKLDLKSIMAQSSSEAPSGLSIGLSKERKEEKPSGSFHSKMSQKERKRLQQAQQLGQPVTPAKPQPAPPTVSPWQAVASQRKNAPSGTPPVAASPQSARTVSTPHLTMRQTVAKTGPGSKQKPQQQPPQPSRSSPAPSSSQARPASSGPGMSVSTTPIPTPHSVRHIPLPSHSPTSPSQNLTMTEILTLQIAEKEYIRDAAAKRSLQEIQQEQEFQEWWDQESKRVIQEEEQKKKADERAAKAPRGRGRGRRGGGAKGKGNKEDGDGEDVGRGKVGSRDVSGNGQSFKDGKAALKEDGGGRGGRGRGRGQRGGRGGGGGRGGRGREGSSTKMATVAKESG